MSFRSTSDQVWLEDQAWLESRYPDLAELHAAGTNMTAIEATIRKREAQPVCTGSAPGKPERRLPSAPLAIARVRHAAEAASSAGSGTPLMPLNPHFRSAIYTAAILESGR